MRAEAHQRLVGPDPHRATEFGLGIEQQVRVSGLGVYYGGVQVGTILPPSITLDPLFLFYLPTEGGAAAPWLWGGLLLITAVAIALPWITRGRALAEPSEAKSVGLPVVNILLDRCTGCTKCALDCPYGAIEMVERHDDKPHKFIAIADPKLCVSCGICVGSCDGVAVSLGAAPPELLWDAVALRLTLAKAKAPDQPLRLVITCDRHAAQGARPFLAENRPVPVADTAVEIVTVPCVGTLPPDLMVRALEAGAHDVQMIGCPPDDCRNREGNLWAEKPITRQRVPRLNRAYANAHITAAWVAPDEFAAALKTPLPAAAEPGAEPDFMTARRMYPDISWRSLAILFVMMVLAGGHGGTARSRRTGGVAGSAAGRGEEANVGGDDDSAKARSRAWRGWTGRWCGRSSDPQ